MSNVKAAAIVRSKRYDYIDDYAYINAEYADPLQLSTADRKEAEQGLKELLGVNNPKLNALNKKAATLTSEITTNNSQLANIDNFIGRRNQIAQTYNNSFDSFPIKPQKTISCGYSSWHIYVVRLLNCTREDRNRVFDKMSEAGIGVNIHYIPVHLQPYYSNRGFKRGDFPAAERYYEQCLTLPIHPQLTDDATTHIINTLKGLL